MPLRFDQQYAQVCARPSVGAAIQMAEPKSTKDELSASRAPVLVNIEGIGRCVLMLSGSEPSYTTAQGRLASGTYAGQNDGICWRHAVPQKSLQSTHRSFFDVSACRESYTSHTTTA